MKKNLGSLLLLLLLSGANASLDTAQTSTKSELPSPKDILDAKNSLPETAFAWDDFSPYLTGFLLFCAGYFTATLNPLEKKDKPSTR